MYFLILFTGARGQQAKSTLNTALHSILMTVTHPYQLYKVLNIYTHPALQM